MRKSIVENIISLYREAARVAGIKFGEERNLFWVKNKTGFWPDSIVGTPLEPGIEIIVEQISQDHLPPFWLFANNDSPELEHRLKHFNFREVNRWECMWLTSGWFSKSDKKHKSLVVQEVTDENQLNNWWSVVKPVMMPSRNIDPKVLINWLNSDAFILLAGLVAGEAVSAGMAYVDNGVAGLYFISTLPDHQRLGYASALVSALIEMSFNKDAEEIILHASNAGLCMYSQLGFKHEGVMSTYWKVGKF